jgi:starch phosphorylase
MARLTPAFSANRSVREYTDQYYLPLAAAYQTRAGDGGDFARSLQAWRRKISTHWHHLHFGELRTQVHGDAIHFEIPVFLAELDPGDVRVELYAHGAAGDAQADGPARIEMVPRGPLVGSAGGYLYTAAVPATRPASDYTPRIVPWKEGAAIPLEASEILWQR